MSKLMRSSVAAAAVMGILLPSAAMAQECKDFAAVGSGLTESIASLMALQGAVNVAENRDWQVIGEAKLRGCKEAGIFGVECTAVSHACRKKH